MKKELVAKIQKVMDEASVAGRSLTAVHASLEKKFKPIEDINVIMVIDRYRNYLKWWTATYGSTNPKYVKSENKKKHLFDFITFELYKKDWVIEKTKRDDYIFGKYDPEQLEKSVRVLLKEFNLEIK